MSYARRRPSVDGVSTLGYGAASLPYGVKPMDGLFCKYESRQDVAYDELPALCVIFRSTSEAWVYLGGGYTLIQL